MALIEEGNTLLLVSRRVPSMSKASRRMSLLHAACRLPEEPAEEKTKFTLCSNHNRSLLRRQPGAMTIGSSPKGEMPATLCMSQL